MELVKRIMEPVGGLLLLIVSIALFIIQIISLVKSVKKEEKKYWIQTFCLEIIPIILQIGIISFYNYITPEFGFMAGFTYIIEKLICLGAIIAYFVMFCITVIAGIIVFEKRQKLKNKKSENPLKLISAFIIILIGLCFFAVETFDNWNLVETTGTVIDYEGVIIGGVKEYWPIIQFDADGEKHEDSYPIDDTKIGDNITIYYDKYYDITPYITNNKIIWISSFIIGILIILFRFKEDIKTKILNKKLNNKR